MKRIHYFIASCFVVLAMVAVPLIATASPVAASAQQELCEGASGTWDAKAKTCSGNTDVDALPQQFKNIVNILLFLIGAISVIMIVVGGIRYVVSAGDNSAVTGAKNTILYAVIGVVVSILAYSIVNFVVGQF